MNAQEKTAVFVSKCEDVFGRYNTQEIIHATELVLKSKSYSPNIFTQKVRDIVNVFNMTQKLSEKQYEFLGKHLAIHEINKDRFSKTNQAKPSTRASVPQVSQQKKSVHQLKNGTTGKLSVAEDKYDNLLEMWAALVIGALAYLFLMFLNPNLNDLSSFPKFSILAGAILSGWVIAYFSFGELNKKSKSMDNSSKTNLKPVERSYEGNGQ